MNIIDNIDRIIQDGVFCYRALCRDNNFLAGAGAFEMYMSNNIKNYAKTIKGLDQYAISKFGESFEVIPRFLIENSGLNVNEVIANLNSKNLTDNLCGLDLKVFK